MIARLDVGLDVGSRGRQVLALALVVLLILALGGEPVRLALRYDRAAIAAGGWWRPLTCAWVHLNGWHAVLNAAGLCLLALVCPEPRLGPTGWVWRMALLTLGMSAGLWWQAPQVPDYVGLSGPLYGLFVLGFAAQAARGDRLAVIGLLLIMAALSAEWIIGSPAAEERWIGGHVVVLAHLYGVAAALVYVAVAWLARATRGTPAT